MAAETLTYQGIDVVMDEPSDPPRMFLISGTAARILQGMGYPVQMVKCDLSGLEMGDG